MNPIEYGVRNFDNHMVVVGGHGGGGLGCIWFIGWLFTIGYLKLDFWRGVLALVIWPYYIGKHFHGRG